MSIYPILENDLNHIAPLFLGWNDTLIWSCLQGCMGSAWADSRIEPASAQIIIADFIFFSGIPNKKLVQNRPEEYSSDNVIMVPQNEDWARLIEEVYGSSAAKITRYAIKKEPHVFNVEKLETILTSLPSEYDLRIIDEEIYHQAAGERWSEDLCSQFKTYGDYQMRGLGAAVLHNGELVAGASSYTVYPGGIEIEIDTRIDYRRKGLALACGAKLILECIRRKLYPSWDAHNLGSVALSEKLGYHFDKEYAAYEISNYTRLA